MFALTNLNTARTGVPASTFHTTPWSSTSLPTIAATIVLPVSPAANKETQRPH